MKTILPLLLVCAVSLHAAELSNSTDSVNYAVGLLNGLQLRSQDKNVASDIKTHDALLKSMDETFAADKQPSQLQRLAGEVAVMMASQSEKGLADVKQWVYIAPICLQGLTNGLLGDTAWSEKQCIEFFQSHYTQAMTDSAKAVKQRYPEIVTCPKQIKTPKLKTTNDSLNYAFGLLNGKQLRTVATTADEQQEILSHINVALKKYNRYSRYSIIGSSIGQSLREQREHGFLGIKTIPLNYPLMRQGLADGMNDVTAVFNAETAEQYITQIVSRAQQEMAANAGAEAKREGEAFLALNAERPEVMVTPSGLQYEVLRAGTGERHPSATSTVKVHYHGMLIDGTVFDSSVERGEPISFPLNQVIRGWTEGVQLMTEGAKFRFFIPYQLAYGERGAGGQIPPYAALIFDVELLEIQ